MKQIVMNTVSDKLYESIAAYEDTTDYVNKKADFADALGFVASQMMIETGAGPRQMSRVSGMNYSLVYRLMND